MNDDQKRNEANAVGQPPAGGGPAASPPSGAASGSGVDDPGWILSDFERLVERAPGQVVVIIRDGDRIIIRDNSGIVGLTGEPLMDKTIALLDELFPRQNT